MRSKSKRRLAFSATASLLFLSLGGLVGCAPPEEGIVRLVDATEVKVSEDQESSQSRLRIIAGSNKIGIGDDVRTALTGGFGKPSKALDLTNLPPGFDDSFRYQGWETSERTVGLITRNGKVLMAMDTREDIPLELRDHVVNNYVAYYDQKPTLVGTDRVHYYFWNDDPIVLMVCSTVDDRGRHFLTQAVGLAPVMSHLRMDPSDGLKDAQKAQAAFETRLKAAKAP